MTATAEAQLYRPPAGWRSIFQSASWLNSELGKSPSAIFLQGLSTPHFLPVQSYILSSNQACLFYLHVLNGTNLLSPQYARKVGLCKALRGINLNRIIRIVQVCLSARFLIGCHREKMCRVLCDLQYSCFLWSHLTNVPIIKYSRIWTKQNSVGHKYTLALEKDSFVSLHSTWSRY